MTSSAGNLVRALDDDRSARRALREMVQAAGNDRDGLATVLDPLARAAADGSEAALDLLLWAIDDRRLAHSAIRRLLVDETDVEEVAQDVLVAVAETVAGFRGEARFTTWLHQVARFKAIALLRRKRDTYELAADAAEVGDTVRISSLIATRTSIDDVLRTLPEDYRAPVLLRDVQHLPYDQIARQLGLNLNTAKSRVARGRALVAGRLAR